jgi:hypothetical protein
MCDFHDGAARLRIHGAILRTASRAQSTPEANQSSGACGNNGGDDDV